MKKLISFLLAVLLLAALGNGALAAEDAAEPEFTVADMLAANTWDEVFSRHDSLLIRRQYEEEEPTDCYITEDYACDLSTGNLFDREDNWRFLEVNGEEVFSLDWYVMTEEERDSLIWKPEYLFLTMIEEYLLKTEIIDLTENEDGSLTISLLLNAENMAAAQAALGSPLPEEYEGMENVIIFTVDADTLEILSNEEYTVLGEEITFLSRVEIEYDVEQPERAGEMLALAEQFRTVEPENPRTITVIYGVGTDEEESFSVVADKQYRIIPFLREGYGLYSDPNGTEAFVSREDVADTVLYAFPIQD